MDAQKDAGEDVYWQLPVVLILSFPVKDVMGLLTTLPNSSWGQHTLEQTWLDRKIN